MGSLETINVKLGNGDPVSDIPDQTVVVIESSPGSSEAKLIAETFREFNDERCAKGIQPVKVIEVKQASPNQTPGATNTAPIPDLGEAFIEPSPLRKGFAARLRPSINLEEADSVISAMRDQFEEIYGEPAEQVRAIIPKNGNRS